MKIKAINLHLQRFPTKKKKEQIIIERKLILHDHYAASLKLKKFYSPLDIPYQEKVCYRATANRRRRFIGLPIAYGFPTGGKRKKNKWGGEERYSMAPNYCQAFKKEIFNHDEF